MPGKTIFILKMGPDGYFHFQGRAGYWSESPWIFRVTFQYEDAMLPAQEYPLSITETGYSYDHFNGLVQDCSISSALAMENIQSCTKPSILSPHWESPYTGKMVSMWRQIFQNVSQQTVTNFTNFSKCKSANCKPIFFLVIKSIHYDDCCWAGSKVDWIGFV